jgi:hypothetical protein
MANKMKKVIKQIMIEWKRKKKKGSMRIENVIKYSFYLKLSHFNKRIPDISNDTKSKKKKVKKKEKKN